MEVDGKRYHRKLRRMMACVIISVIVTGSVGVAGWSVANTVFAEAGDIKEENGNEFTDSLFAKSAVLLDGDSGRILFGKDADTPRPMASTTKIMTCIIALEYMQDENEIAEVSDNAAIQPKVHLNVKQGQQFYLRDLLYSLMLESHNDSAVIIAEHIGGSVRGFSELMNEKAREIGCENTYFITPNGLDASDEHGTHSTTAGELAKMMKYCVVDSPKKNDFIEITGTRSYTFQDVACTQTYSCTNHNAFLDMMDGAFSGKTGFTGDAGYCYVGALQKDGKTLIVALLACGWPNNKSYKWSDTKKLMKYGLDHYTKKKIWKDPELPSVQIENGVPDDEILGNRSSVGVMVENPATDWQFLLRDDEIVRISVDMEESVRAPVRQGEVLGTLTYDLNGDEIGRWNIISMNHKEKRTLFWCLAIILQMYIKINQ